jgi:hypothetical protein
MDSLHSDSRFALLSYDAIDADVEKCYRLIIDSLLIKLSNRHSSDSDGYWLNVVKYRIKWISPEIGTVRKDAFDAYMKRIDTNLARANESAKKAKNEWENAPKGDVKENAKRRLDRITAEIRVLEAKKTQANEFLDWRHVTSTDPDVSLSFLYWFDLRAAYWSPSRITAEELAKLKPLFPKISDLRSLLDNVLHIQRGVHDARNAKIARRTQFLADVSELILKAEESDSTDP